MMNKFDDIKQYEIDEQELNKKFKFYDLIGKGAYGEVYKVSNLQTRKIFALKYCSCQENELYDNFKQELQFMEYSDENVIKYHEMYFSKDSFPNKYKYYIVMDHCESDLQKKIDEQNQKKEPFSQQQAYSYMFQIISGLHYLHEKNIAYRDLKPSNILLKKQNNDQYIVKLADFGTTKNVQKQTVFTDLSIQGTIYYWPYELLNTHQTKSINYFKQDIYSLGIISLLLFYTPTISIENIFEQNQISNYEMEIYIDKIRPQLDHTTMSLMKKLTAKTYQQRPQTKEIISVLTKYKGQIIQQTKCILRAFKLNMEPQNGFYQKIYSNGVYVGDFIDGKRTGKGIFTLNNGDIYEGDWVDDKMTGKGIFKRNNRDVYKGDFIDGKQTGKGIYTWNNGDVYEGDWVDSKMTGKGIYFWNNRNVYKGDFVDDKKTGKGKYFWNNGDVYEGDFIDGKQTGKGILTLNNGDVYEGDWVDNELTRIIFTFLKNCELLLRRIF
ncbi:Protein kinase-like domain [Pseudocohnilembus persalinus]|uniref:Protein kinase-like domain n=1 Tax=Pseudocohnilembus persalinus TaxID=266149 RepID=A0A0V0R648_PSEPJ|nr:Protein kinase-like domain [Pseudocohnilembus persalinus]|eukprot:KRX09970.1 Protein kinase-like domain [Pseudocohnilembus persalinus]